MLTKDTAYIYDRIIRPKYINDNYLLPNIKLYFNIDNKDVLDFGCGTGCNSFMFDPLNYKGVDVDVNRVQYALRKTPEYSYIVTKQQEKLPFNDKCFDIIFICGVLHHLNDNDCIMYGKEFKRVLKPDGCVIILEPYYSKRYILNNLVMKFFDKGKYIREKMHYQQLYSDEFNVCFKSEFITPNFYNTIMLSLLIKSS